MKIAHFRFKAQGARQLCQLDHNRQIVPDDKVTKLVSENVIECSTADKSIEVAFYLRAEIDLIKLPKGVAPKDCVTALAFSASRFDAPRLAKALQWNLYGGEWVRYNGELITPPDKDAWCFEHDEELNEHLAMYLAEATKRHRDAQAAFEAAKKCLSDNMNYARGNAGQLQRSARFLADSMRNDNTQYMWAWNQEKSPRFTRGIEDLIRRKNPNHPNYIHTVEQLESLLYDIRPPMLWCQSPRTSW